MSYAARPIPLSATGAVTTQHGVVLQTNTLDDDPTPTAVAVPGPAGTTALDPAACLGRPSARPRRRRARTGQPAGFDGALQHLSRHADRATAVSAAKMIDYPSDQLHLDNTGGGVRIPLLMALGLTLSPRRPRCRPLWAGHAGARFPHVRAGDASRMSRPGARGTGRARLGTASPPRAARVRHRGGPRAAPGMLRRPRPSAGHGDLLLGQRGVVAADGARRDAPRGACGPGVAAPLRGVVGRRGLRPAGPRVA